MIRRNLTYLMFLLPLIAALCLAAPAQQQTPPASTPAPQAAAAGSDLVVLRVAGEPITEKQVIAAISVLARQKQSADRHAAGTQRDICLKAPWTISSSRLS